MRPLERINRSLRIEVYTLRKENRELKEDKLKLYRTRVDHRQAKHRTVNRNTSLPTENFKSEVHRKGFTEVKEEIRLYRRSTYI